MTDLQFTSDGALWLATANNGIARFDGLKFSGLSERDGLLDNRVFCIHAEKGGVLWFGTEKGASRLNPVSGEWKSFPSGTNGLTAGRVFDIEGTPDGVIWLRTREGLSRFDGQSFQAVSGIPRIDQDPGRMKAKALAVDQQGRVWTVTEAEGLWRVEGTNAVEMTELGTERVFRDALHIAPDGRLWFQDGDDGRITRYDGQRFERLQTLESGVRTFTTAIHTSPDGIMWLGDIDGGVTRFDPVRFTFARLNEGRDAPSNWILKIQTGADGALWFATMTGLYRYEEETFVNYGKMDGLSDESAFLSVATKDGSIWFSGIERNWSLVRVDAGQTNRWQSRFVSAADEGSRGSRPTPWNRMPRAAFGWRSASGARRVLL